MGFLDDIKSRFSMGQGGYAQDGYDQGDGYDEYYDDADDYGAADYQSQGYDVIDGGYSPRYTEPDHNPGLLGQTRRGEAESVAVYTRSGQLVGDADRHATTYNTPARSEAARPGAYDTPSSYAESLRSAAETRAAATTSDVATHVSSVVNAVPQLPAYILRPESYDDVETVVRRVRTRQPVALVFVGVRTEVAKRVLDFSYGFACGLGASVKEIADRVFMVLPQGCEVKDSDLSKLRTEGYIKSK